MNSNTNPADPAEDRRNFFRIDDSVILTYKSIPAEELPVRVARLEEGFPDEFTVSASLAAIGRTMTVQLHHIRQQLPDVAAYLKSMDEKLDVLARAFLARDTSLTEQRACRANISASGMSFYAGQPVPLGSVLETKLVLYPTFMGILTYGEVVRCIHSVSEDQEFPFQIAIEFVFIRESDRDLLIRHVLQKQHDALREQRLQNPR